MASREIEITVPPGKVRERLDVFLTHHIENVTRSKVQAAIGAGLVLVDGKPARASYKISPGEVIHITIPKPPPPDVLPENIHLDIVYEDDYLLIVDKPAGMVTHPAFGNYTGTLVNALLYHCNNRLSTLNDNTRPGIVHRLDKDTSGLMVVAKDDVSHAKLAQQFSRRIIDREYWSLVWGRFEGKEKKSGVIEASLGRSKSDRKKITVSESGKTAATEYTVLEEFEYLSLLKLKLRTGRTHQIRVHLHHVGHPVFGDPTYGGRRIAWGGTDKKKKEEVHRFLNMIGRQALHAKTIGFVHPATHEKMKFDSELPEDMREVLRFLRDE
ncbi:MAG: RluA family pseudouridine synthase [Ignavibacteriae bacterium]|nr:RluA family pseudouridine synthase [Ignavibacteria bacterium]MBI3364651.1 RluA family pseudouridine synthase [Ignavibacteriota bacterium]